MRRRLWRAWNELCELHCPHHGRYCRGRSCCCRDRHWGGPVNDKHRRQPPNLGYTTGICLTGKRSYFTMAGAKKAAKALRQRGEKAIHSYRCDHCQHCHIGHLPFAVRRGIQTQSEWRSTR